MNTINPVLFSTEENKFLVENLGTAPIVVMNKPMPAGVNPRAIRPVLQEVYDREQLRAAEKVEWLGVEKVKQGILKYLEVDAKWAEDYRRTRGRTPRLPSMFVKDGKGRYRISASGSDSNYPRTWVDEDGGRHFFEMNLDGEEENYVEEPVQAAPVSLVHDEAKNRIECPICNHTESYREDSKSSYNAARARMSRHLKSTNVKEPSLHAELHTNEFGA